MDLEKQSEYGKVGGEMSALAKQQRIIEYNENPTRCLFCDTPLPYATRKNKFCDQSCAAKFNNAQRGFESRKKLPNCLHCGKELTEHRAKYCSNKCMGQFIRKQSFAEFAAGEKTLGPYQLRIYLLELKGHQCEVCSLSEWQKLPIPLEVDHIDGNSENNDIMNLRLLCPNCHALTPTYKNKNKGRGRAGRREIYRKGTHGDVAKR